MINFEALTEAVSLVFTFKTLMWLAIGVFVGVGVGAIPGLTATTGVALMLPLTFTMDQRSVC
jgi:putative tricarboxylic transport membrane protein